MRTRHALILLPFLGAASAQAQVSFVDTFDSAADLAKYATDRRDPGAFTLGTMGGESTAKLTVDGTGPDDAFFSFQGKIRYNDGAGDPYFVNPVGSYASVDVFVPTSWQTQFVGADFWLRMNDVSDPTDESLRYYPSIGFYGNYTGEGDPGLNVEIWDGQNFHELELPTGFVFDAFHTLKMEHGGDALRFYLDDTLLFTDVNAGYGTKTLDNVFLQGWNGENLTYDIHFDNVTVQAVPEPATLAALGLGAIALLRRRKRA